MSWPPATLLTRMVRLRSERLATRSAMSSLVADEASRTAVRKERLGNSWRRAETTLLSLLGLRPCRITLKP